MTSADQWIAEYGKHGDDWEWIRKIQLDAMQEGMRRAAAIIKDHWNNSETICNQRDQASRSSHVLLESAESLTDQDIAAITGTTLAK